MSYVTKDKIYLYLKKSAVLPDKMIFNEYANGEIEIEECLLKFKKNNEIRDNVTISIRAFENWLISLGYWRY